MMIIMIRVIMIIMLIVYWVFLLQKFSYSKYVAQANIERALKAKICWTKGNINIMIIDNENNYKKH